MSQTKSAVVHLITHIELFLRPKLCQHILLFCRSGQLFLISGNHTSGNVAFHSRLITVLKACAPIHIRLFAVPVYLAFASVKVHLIYAQIVHTECMEHIITPLLEFAEQIAPFQGRHNKICRRLEHIRRIFQQFHRRIVHPVKADKLFSVIQWNHHKRMHVLFFQALILERIRFPDFFQISDDNMFANAEFPIPACANLSRHILKIFLFRLHAFGHPLICIVVAAGLVPLKYINPFPVQRFSQMLYQHFQRLVRGFLQQGDTKPFIDDGFQILNALYSTLLS